MVNDKLTLVLIAGLYCKIKIFARWQHLTGSMLAEARVTGAVQFGSACGAPWCVADELGLLISLS